MSVNIKQSGSLKQIAAFLPNNLITVSSLPDTDITNIQAGQSLVYDGELNKWINYSAKIILTYDNYFQGKIITCTQEQTVISKTAPLSENTLVFYVNTIGTWVISNGDFSVSVVVSVVGDIVSAKLQSVPQGSTVTPTDDIQTWLKCANITDKSYTTLSEVLADRETFETLIADSNACDYMVRSNVWASVTTNDADAMALIGMYDYCADTLLNDDTWHQSICNSTYFESVLNVKVPLMTSDTAPSGQIVYYNTFNSSYLPRYAFDRNGNTAYVSAKNTPNNRFFIGYRFDEDVKLYKAEVKANSFNASYYYDNAVWGTDNITSFPFTRLSGTMRNQCTEAQSYTKSVIFRHDTVYKYYVIAVASTNASNTYNDGVCWNNIREIQFYGRRATNNYVGLVPVMTSDTTPFGEAFSSSVVGSDNAYKAFDSTSSSYAQITYETNGYIGYHFTLPKTVDRCSMLATTSTTASFVLEGSNDNTSWTTLGTFPTPATGASSADYTLDVNNSTPYSYYRVRISQRGSETAWTSFAFYTIQFYSKLENIGVVHSTANDTIYYKNSNNQNVILCSTDEKGKGFCDIRALDNNIYTFYSTVAKKPSNLADDYSRAIRITKSQYGNTTELYLMPDTVKTLYWWGYESDNLEDMNTANGWIHNSRTFGTPTRNTYDIQFSASSSNVVGVGVKNQISPSSAYVISNSITGGTAFLLDASKNMTSTTTYKNITMTGSAITKTDMTSITNSGILYVRTATNSYSAKINALWYE